MRNVEIGRGEDNRRAGFKLQDTERRSSYSP